MKTFFFVIIVPKGNGNVKLFRVCSSVETLFLGYLFTKKNECLQCSLCNKHGVSYRASAVKGYLILRKDANTEVLYASYV